MAVAKDGRRRRRASPPRLSLPHEHLGEGGLGGVGAAGEVLDTGDLGDRDAGAGSGRVHDDVDRLRHQGVEGGERYLAGGVGQLAHEAQPGEGLAGRPGVDGGEPGDPPRTA